MSKIQDSARRWSGYVCPDCRFVFRVPRDHDGSGLVCPSCRRLLRLPQPGDAVPPLLATQASPRERNVVETSRDPASEEGRQVRRKRKRKRRKDESPTWEESRRQVMRGESLQGRLALVAGLVLLVGILAVVIFITRGGGDSPPAIVELPDESRLPQTLPPEELPPSPPVRRDDAQFVIDAQPVAQAFLEATTVEELLKLVNRPELVAEQIKRYHPDGSIDAPGLGEFNQFSQVRHSGPYGTVVLRTADHQVRQMTFREYPDGLKVDWQSWVGWSDLAWDEFIENRPPGAHVFRALVRDVEYYNFDFTDDRKWQSYRLTSPDEDHTLYGYVERDSPAHVGLRTVLDEGLSRVMVELRFPDDAAGQRQVIITQLLAKDWVNPEHPTEP